MASVVRRGKAQFQARVRHKGFPTLVKTFATRQDALHWATMIESEMARNAFITAQTECEKTTLSEALDRYSREVTPHKKGAANNCAVSMPGRNITWQTAAWLKFGEWTWRNTVMPA